MSPGAAATSSIGSCISVDATIGTPESAEAAAGARSPCSSSVMMAMTPIRDVESGIGMRSPNSAIHRSRSAAPESMRGTIPHRSKTATFARCVCPSPAPPAT